jgi:hypothetical protein
VWAKVDDGWWCHPKVIGLSLPASGLWVRALSWSCAQRTDLVPESFVNLVGGTGDIAGELVDAGLWIVDPDGWRIHDWNEYQSLTVSERRAEAGRKGGIASGRKRSKPQANPKQKQFANEASDEAGTHPVPSRPVKTSSAPSATETIAAAIDEAVRQRQATATGIRNPEAWRRVVRDQIIRDEDGETKATRLLETYPTANASQLAAALNGSTVALRLLPRESLPEDSATPHKP